MKKLISFKLILSAGLLAVIILPVKVSAQQNLLLNNPVATVPLNLNNSVRVINLTTPGVLKQSDQINSFKVQPNQTPVILDRPNSLNPLVTSLNGKKTIKVLGNSIKYAALDHMPIVTPDMSLYRMPTLSGAALDNPNPK